MPAATKQNTPFANATSLSQEGDIASLQFAADSLESTVEVVQSEIHDTNTRSLSQGEVIALLQATLEESNTEIQELRAEIHEAVQRLSVLEQNAPSTGNGNLLNGNTTDY